MSDQTPEPDDQDAPAPADNLAELREAANRSKAAQSEAEAARRELAFVKAGINTDEGVGKLLFQSYTGDASKDAVLAAAAEYGITPGGESEQPPDTAPPITDEERSQTRERAQLATESEVPGGQPDPDPVAVGFAEFHQARAEGVPLNDAADHVIGRIFEAAYAKHDPRVIHNQEQWEAENRGSSKAR